MPCPFTVSNMFCASPKIWLHLVSLQNLLCWHKNQFYWKQIIFLSGTKCLWLPQYVHKFLVWHKRFGPAQKILGPVKGQGTRYYLNYLSWKYDLLAVTKTCFDFKRNSTKGTKHSHARMVQSLSHCYFTRWNL